MAMTTMCIYDYIYILYIYVYIPEHGSEGSWEDMIGDTIIVIVCRTTTIIIIVIYYLSIFSCQ